MSELKKLPNIGSELEKLLLQVGINTVSDLLSIGSKEVFVRIISLNPQEGCLNKLLALEGACQNIRWHQLDNEKKRELKNYFDILQPPKGKGNTNPCQ